jgi:hypothetical protein
MQQFGDNIKDLPVDKDESKSADQDLVNSIFLPQESGMLTKEVKLAIIGVILLYMLFTDKVQYHLYGITKNDNLTKATAVGIVVISLFMLNKYL